MMTSIPITIQNAISNGKIDRYAASSDFWSVAADISAVLVIVAIFGEALELIPKLIDVGLKKKWRFIIKRKAKVRLWRFCFWKWRHCIDLIAFIFWIIVVLGLVGELACGRISKHFDSLIIADLQGRAERLKRPVSESFENGRARFIEVCKAGLSHMSMPGEIVSTVSTSDSRKLAEFIAEAIGAAAGINWHQSSMELNDDDAIKSAHLDGRLFVMEFRDKPNGEWPTQAVVMSNAFVAAFDGDDFGFNIVCLVNPKAPPNGAMRMIVQE